MYGVAYLEKKDLLTRDYLPPDGVVFYKSRVDPLANTSIKPTLYWTVISSEARHKMRINQLTKLVYRAAEFIGAQVSERLTTTSRSQQNVVVNSLSGGAEQSAERCLVRVDGGRSSRSLPWTQFIGNSD